ncbi:MAG: protein-export chaperone SecB [Rhizobiales bacterium]|nr:protein-export chaperone SecB [Hyphomicrobiales bacterium]
MSKTAKPAPKKAAKATGNGGGDKDKPPKVTAATAAQPLSVEAPQPQPGSQPSMRVLGQYLKDLSFENPNAPQSLAPQQTQPDINIAVNVNARNLAPTDFEVELHLDAKATLQGKVVFAAELLYAGAFRLENFPQNLLHPAVLIECPRILFPFARQILADATRNGGFPPLMLDPIDFASMYQKRMQQQKAAATVAKN